MSTEIVKQSSGVAKFNYFDADQFAVMQRLATMFAKSDIVPERYRISDKQPAEKAIANCMIAIETAMRMDASPVMVMQNLDIIEGKPGWSSKFLIATINTCGKYETLQYRLTNLGKIGKIKVTEYRWENNKKVTVQVDFDGSDIDNWECVAYTCEKGKEIALESSEVSVLLAIHEGWYTKRGSKWPRMTKKMLRYRAASFWTNEFAPELSLGFKSTEENADIEDIEFEDVSARVAKEVKEKANKEPIGFDAKPVKEKPVDQTPPATEEKEPATTSDDEDPGYN